jgi:hypothetical protein
MENTVMRAEVRTCAKSPTRKRRSIEKKKKNSRKREAVRRGEEGEWPHNEGGRSRMLSFSSVDM